MQRYQAFLDQLHVLDALCKKLIVEPDEMARFVFKRFLRPQVAPQFNCEGITAIVSNTTISQARIECSEYCTVVSESSFWTLELSHGLLMLKPVLTRVPLLTCGCLGTILKQVVVRQQ